MFKDLKFSIITNSSLGRVYTHKLLLCSGDPEVKPPFSYAALICLAMLDSGNGASGGKMSLTGIYDWIKDNFAYYRNCKRPWQVSFVKFLHLS